jgi:hypothetical protein
MVMLVVLCQVEARGFRACVRARSRALLLLASVLLLNYVAALFSLQFCPLSLYGGS